MNNKIIAKYFWSLNKQALKETEEILKDPEHPKYSLRIFTLLSRCDKPKELFSLIDKTQFVASWPRVRHYWQKNGQARDFMLWWEGIYSQLADSSKQLKGEAPKELKEIGKKLLNARVEKGWGQADVAKRTGITQPEISRIEKGTENITLSTLIRICRVLEVKEIIF